MKRQYFLFLIILALLLAACIPSHQATSNETTQEGSSSAEPTRPHMDASLNCLSPAFQMNVARAVHTATLLPDGRVLIAGGFRAEGTSEVAIASTEIFDPDTNTFTLAGNMNEPRVGHISVLLPDGKVLLAGGWNETSRSSTAELYDPQTGTFEFTGTMMVPRQGMTGALLKNGQVLIAGGDSAHNTSQVTAELYDPATKTFIPTGNLNDGRMGHTATLLADGKVLLVGGTAGNDTILASAEIYDPDTGEFTRTSNANTIRYKHTAVLLQDGNVLVLGGANEKDWAGKYDSAEIYDASTGIFTRIANMNRERFKFTDAAVRLKDGNVLIAGGNRQIEIFDSQSQTFILGDTLDSDYFYSVLTPLDNGQVLITGGYDANIQPSNKAWLHCE